MRLMFSKVVHSLTWLHTVGVAQIRARKAQGEKSLGLEAAVGAATGNSQTLQVTYTNPDNVSSPIGERAFTLIKLEVVVPVAAQDGVSSGSFSVLADLPSGLTVDSYGWEWHTDHHPNSSFIPAGNFFSDTTSAEPTVPTPRWYSTTGSKYQPLGDPNGNGAPFSSDYEISCVVTISGVPVETGRVKWNVFVPEPAVNHPSFNGKRPILTKSKTGNKIPKSNADEYIATVDNRNGFERIGPLPNAIYNSFSSDNQFYQRIIVTHENEHISQWNSILPWSGLYNADTLWQQIEGMTAIGGFATCEADLRNAINDLIDATTLMDNELKDNSFNCRERKAHNQSNAEGPDYLEVDINHTYPNNNPNYTCDV